MLRMSRVSSTPSTRMRPPSCSSSRLMQRIIVDLPEPDGPMTTTTSCRATLRSMSRSAWNVPKNFCTPISSSITSPVPAICVASAKTEDVVVFAHRVPTPSRRSSRWLSRLIVMHPTQNRNITNEIVSGSEPLAAEVLLRRRHVGDLEDVEQPHRRAGERGVLEQADELPDDRRDDVAQRLGQDDQRRRLDRLEPERLGRLGLPAGQRLQAAAHDLGDVGGGEQGEHDDRPHDEPRCLHALGAGRSRGRCRRAASSTYSGTPRKNSM